MDEILERLKVSKNTNEKPITHTKMNGGKFHIPKKNLSTFYKRLLKYGIEQNETIQLVEKMGDIHPFIVDIDIKYNDIIETHQYNNQTIYDIISFLWAQLSHYCDVSDKSQFGEIWIMEKESPYPCVTHKKYKYKEGIHIAFPNILIKKDTYKKLIDVLKQQKIIEDIFQKTCTIQPANSEDTLFDGCFSSWQPYGCRKPNESYYQLTQVYTIDDLDNPVLLEDSLFQTHYQDNLMICEKMSMIYREKETIQYLQPLEDILKNKLKTKTTNKSNSSSMSNIYGGHNQYYVDNNNIVNPYEIVEKEELKLIKGLVTCLSKDRAEDYHKWLYVGMCLHNINENNLEIWKMFSQLSSSYQENICNQKWKSFNNQYNGAKYGKPSLIHWAKEDNFKKFAEIKKESVELLVDNSIKKGANADYLIALVVKKYYDKEFISVDVNDEWYYFNGIRWERTLKGTILKRYIHNHIYNLYGEYYLKYSQIAGLDPESEDKKKHLKNVSEIQLKLLKDSYVNGLLNSLRDLFYEKDIMEKFDSDLNLLGFEDGIYDLKENVFREGRPEDYITMSTKVKLHIPNNELPIELNKLQDKFKQMDNYTLLKNDFMDFITKIIPDEECRQYTLRFISKCLSGENRDEVFYIWTGSGGNGKSKLVDLIMKCLGDYACNLPVSLLTQKRKASGAANPEMARTRGKRFVVMQEPDVNETLNVGEMKEITGNDMIQARGLYKEPFEFVPQFKLVLMCNDLPHIPSNDDGTWRRLEALPFISRFVKEHQVDESQHKYLIDKELKHKLPFWIIPMYTLLLQEWKLYDTDGISIPDKVKDKTNEYRNDNDIIGQWISENTIEGNNIIAANGVTEKAPTDSDTLYEAFKEWTTDEEIDKRSIPNKKKFRENLLKWQGNSSYGLSKFGKDMPNGTKNNPLINLILV